MNRGDFGAVYLPHSLKAAANGTYRVVNKAGAALGTVSAMAVSSLRFAVPADVLSQLSADGLVAAGSIDLYNEALKPTASPANMNRYLAILQKLVPVPVSD